MKAPTTSFKADVAAMLRRPLLAIALFSCVINLLMLVPALFMLQVFDRVLASGSGATLAVLLLGAAIAFGLILLLDQVRSAVQGLLGNILGDTLLPRVAREALARRARQDTAIGPEALRDVATVRGFLSAQPLLAVLDLPWAVIYLGVIWLAHPVLGAAASAAALIMLVLALATERIGRKGIASVQAHASDTQRFLENSLAQAEAAEAMGMGDALLRRWAGMNEETAKGQHALARRTVWLGALTRTLRQVFQVALLAAGAYLVITQASSPGVMIATTVLLSRALAPIEQVVGSWRMLVEGRAAAGRLLALFDGLAKRPQGMPLPAPEGHLDAAGLVWRPAASDRLVLAGVSVRIAAGESVMVVGPSGAGKSTLLRVLCGLWKPQSGVVRLDGSDLQSWSREELGPHIGYLPQDVELFPGTVAENIARMGEVDSEKVIAAAEAAGVHTMVQGLPQGYDTRIDPQGGLLSPGQRQRIGLARALYGQPRLVLLDEPNSNLDGAGEVALAETLARLAGKATVVLVAHRHQFAQHVHKMLVLEAGRVRHFGPVAEVVKAMSAGNERVVPMARATSEVMR